MSAAAPVVVKFRVLRDVRPPLLVVPGREDSERHVLVLGVTKAAALRLAQRLLGVALNLPDDPHLLAPVVTEGELIEEREARDILERMKAAASRAKSPESAA